MVVVEDQEELVFWPNNVSLLYFEVNKYKYTQNPGNDGYKWKEENEIC
jgi:hypothetical protein